MHLAPLVAVTLIVCYLIGAIPTAYIFGRLFKGVDIRKEGSGNVGATNVYRVVGKLHGFLVLALDIFKGYLCVKFIPAIFNSSLITHHSQLLLYGVAVISGHNWPIFLRFKGGKGIATSTGVLLGIMPNTLYACFIIWIIIFMLTRYVSLASISASISLPIVAAILNMRLEYILFSVTLCLISTYKHRANIRRLIQGQEPRAF